MRIRKSVRKMELYLDRKTEKFVWRHPFWGFLLVFIGMPLFILFCVGAGTVVIAFPMSWLLGML